MSTTEARRATAVLVGLLSVGAALAVGHLVAGIVSPASSPFLAVGDAAIRLSPLWLTEFAKAAFGTADKQVLLAGMAVVIAGVAAGAGLLSRRRRTPGTVVVTVLGLLGFAAVVAQPVFAPLDLLAPAASLGTGLLVLRRLHALALSTAAEAAITTRAHPEPDSRAPIPRLAGDVPRGSRESGSEGARVALDVRSEEVRAEGVPRRNVLLWASAGVGAASLVAAGAGTLLTQGAGDSRQMVTARLASARLVERAPAIPAGAAFPELGTPTFLTPAADFYRIDVALRIPRVTAEDWRLRLHGMVGREMSLTFDDLMARPLVERSITMTCVSNPVGGDLISTANFIGVDLRELLLEAGVRPGADQAFATSVDGWYTGTPVDVLMEPDRGAMLAVGMNGEALLPEHGFPVRMVVPGLYGFVSATKWITDLELTTFAARSAYWLERGWAERGPVKTGSRIDRPRTSSTVPAGRVTVAGIAWSQPDGISRVEISADGGPWQDAELATDVSGDTWRMWRAEVDLAPGRHALRCRATAETGVTQTEASTSPVPDGATGWPSVLVTAT